MYFDSEGQNLSYFNYYQLHVFIFISLWEQQIQNVFMHGYRTKVKLLNNGRKQNIHKLNPCVPCTSLPTWNLRNGDKREENLYNRGIPLLYKTRLHHSWISVVPTIKEKTSKYHWLAMHEKFHTVPFFFKCIWWKTGNVLWFWRTKTLLF